ncbi:MAG: hypothetical protein AAFX81_03120 [Pseudomonadota bacterium]
MTSVPMFYAVMVIVAGLIAGVCLWARVRRELKAFVLGLTVFWFALAYGALTELLSRPKPVGFEFAQAAMTEADVLAGDVIEDEAIFVWLKFEGVSEPRAYSMPFDREAAEQLRQALAEGERSGVGVRMRLPFEGSLDDGEPRFYALPQPRLPRKPTPAPDDPLRLDHPGTPA